VGGTINDPVKTTRAMMPAPRPDGDVGALDIGGTWMRFGIFSPNWDLLEVTREPLHKDRRARNEWIANIVTESDVVACGVSTGGTVDPRTGEVWEAKDIIPDYVGTVFELGVPTTALNDGLATAWGHACLPEYAGRRVATLALGTGVGCGFVADGRIWMGPRGQYPRINDLPIGDRSFEDLLGGAALTPKPSAEQRSLALNALNGAAEIIRATMFPDEIVVCGSVGLSGWLQPHVAQLGLRTSPFGADAGLFGAAALALYPPRR
jgi:N-acetylmannosamine-6-phosphate 2-epimerase / N-acetylmannosamine kinase